MFIIALYIVTGVLLLASLYKSREKTERALRLAFKSFEGILPFFLAILLAISMFMIYADKALISKWLGEESGLTGIFLTSIVGSIVLMPAFVSYPLAAQLLQAGAGYPQITMLITSILMVGVMTMPLEKSYFGKRLTILRNALAFIYCFIAAFVIGAIFS